MPILNLDSVEGLVSRVWARRYGARISVVISDCSLLKTSRPALEPTQHPTQWVPGFIPSCSEPEGDVDRAPPSRA
jgi:hypothetical protein